MPCCLIKTVNPTSVGFNFIATKWTSVVCSCCVHLIVLKLQIEKSSVELSTFVQKNVCLFPKNMSAFVTYGFDKLPYFAFNKFDGSRLHILFA